MVYINLTNDNTKLANKKKIQLCCIMYFDTAQLRGTVSYDEGSLRSGHTSLFGSLISLHLKASVGENVFAGAHVHGVYACGTRK